MSTLNHPAAFLCYPTRADRAPGQPVDADGPITQLRAALQEEVRILTGEEDFTIFQDRTQIDVGEDWQARIKEGLEKATLLIVMIQPLLFKSKWCMDEIQAFTDAERRAGRQDLIIPVLYVRTDDLQVNSGDPIKAALARRQHFDWTRYRNLPISSPEVTRAVGALAESVARALERSRRGAPAGATTPAPAAPSTPTAPSRAAREALYVLLLEMFSVDELSRLLRYSYGDLTYELPSGAVSPSSFTSAAVDALARRGQLNADFFKDLVKERPMRGPRIREVAAQFGVQI